MKSCGEQFCDPARWLDQHGDHLYRYAMFRLRDTAAAEDAVQDTLLAAMKGCADFRGASSERTWLVGILRHKILDRFREVTRQQPLYDIDAFDDLYFQGNGHWQVDSAPIAWRAKPDELIERKEFWNVFDHGLSSLSARTATAFILREIDGFGTDEICDALNVSPENLWVMLHRARLALRRFLQINWFGAPSASSETAGIDSERADDPMPVPTAVSFASHHRLTA
jgi:RNA polymerase sigma-70 factor (ECF subfamily)